MDEYKEGLDKLKSEIQEMDTQLTAKREEVEKLAAAAAASAAVAATAQAEAPAETPSSEAETEILKGPVEFVNEDMIAEQEKESKFGKKKKRNKKNKKKFLLSLMQLLG